MVANLSCDRSTRSRQLLLTLTDSCIELLNLLPQSLHLAFPVVSLLMCVANVFDRWSRNHTHTHKGVKWSPSCTSVTLTFLQNCRLADLSTWIGRDINHQRLEVLKPLLLNRRGHYSRHHQPTHVPTHLDVTPSLLLSCDVRLPPHLLVHLLFLGRQPTEILQLGLLGAREQSFFMYFLGVGKAGAKIYTWFNGTNLGLGVVSDSLPYGDLITAPARNPTQPDGVTGFAGIYMYTPIAAHLLQTRRERGSWPVPQLPLPVDFGSPLPKATRVPGDTRNTLGTERLARSSVRHAYVPLLVERVT